MLSLTINRKEGIKKGKGKEGRKKGGKERKEMIKKG
jgi:hypothetical protein